MLPSDIANSRALTDAIGDHLRNVHKPFGGAHFRAAFARENGLRFLTGCVLFQDHHVAARGEHDYGSLLFVEEWVRDQSDAHARLSRLLSGEGNVGGHEIRHIFQQSFASRDFYSGIGGHPTWRIITQIQRDANWKDLYLPQSPILAYGMRPYASPAHAVNDWVFGIDNPADTSSNVPNQWTFITLLPDFRAKITSAEWLPGSVHLEVDLRVPADQMQLQIVCVGSKRPHHVCALSDGAQDVEVPDDARRLSIFLVDRTNDCVAQLQLSSVYETFGNAKRAREGLTQMVAELASGENDRVEFKPFIQAKDAKEFEFIKTVIAFANTYGGRIFVGVDDDGTLQGEAVACRVLKETIEESIANQISRLRRLVRENVRPVLPDFQVRQFTVDGKPLVVAEVARGSNPPYATHQNQIFVRKGSTNRTPDPSELRALVSNTGFHL